MKLRKPLYMNPERTLGDLWAGLCAIERTVTDNAGWRIDSASYEYLEKIMPLFLSTKEIEFEINDEPLTIDEIKSSYAYLGERKKIWINTGHELSRSVNNFFKRSPIKAVKRWEANDSKKVVYSEGFNSHRGQKDVEGFDRLQELLPDYELVCVDYPMPFEEALDHHATCEFVITNDSFHGHLANSCGTPAVIFTGPKNRKASRRWQRYPIANSFEILNDFLEEFKDNPTIPDTSYFIGEE